MKQALTSVPMQPAAATPVAAGDNYLFVSEHGPHVTWLTHALQRDGHLLALPAGALDERIAALSPQAVLLDFSFEQAAAATEILAMLKRDWPQLAVLGTGPAAEPTVTLAALRAGVDDFIDTAATAKEIRQTLAALLARRTAQQSRARGRTIALLGARAGLGVTTLATNLALQLQDAIALAPAAAAAATPARGVALLDLGLPARDGLLYLDTASDFSFVDGVRNLRRLDHTLVQTAFARHASGTAVLPLPASLAQVREISHADSAAFIQRLGDHFDFQIADLGGFATYDFIAQTVTAADRSWIVCDQSIGAIVSTARLLRELAERGLAPERIGLVVNMFDPSVALPARDIAARLRLPLAHVLPMRRSALLAASGRGELLSRVARNDPLTVAIQGMARSLRRDFLAPAAPPPAMSSRWGAFMAQLTGKRHAVREE